MALIKDYYTGEIRCTECGKWCEPEELDNYVCRECWQKIESDIEQKLENKRRQEK